MKYQLLKFVIIFTVPFSIILAQTSDNPWTIGLGANTVQIMDDSVESKFGLYGDWDTFSAAHGET